MATLDWLCMFAIPALGVLAALALLKSVEMDRALRSRLAFMAAWTVLFAATILTAVTWASSSATWSA